jgi:hypothetical protein
VEEEVKRQEILVEERGIPYTYRHHGANLKTKEMNLLQQIANKLSTLKEIMSPSTALL